MVLSDKFVKEIGVDTNSEVVDDTLKNTPLPGKPAEKHRAVDRATRSRRAADQLGAGREARWKDQLC